MLELNKFYISDTIEFMKSSMEDNLVDLTVTSPPYDDLRNYNGFKFDYRAMLKELYRVTKIGGVLVWVVGDKTLNGSETGTSFQQALYAKECGFKLHDTMIYSRHAMPNSAKRYNQDFEYMFVFTKGKIEKFNPILEECKYAGYSTSPTTRDVDGNLKPSGKRIIGTHKKKSNIWHYIAGKNKSSKDLIAFDHPAIFPESLAEDHILSWSDEGDIVFDPMCGSGTVAKMAFLNNRRFIGVDVSEEYIEDICIPRLKKCGFNYKFEIKNGLE